MEDILFLDKRPKPGIDIMLTDNVDWVPTLNLGHDCDCSGMREKKTSPDSRWRFKKKYFYSERGSDVT